MHVLRQSALVEALRRDSVSRSFVPRSHFGASRLSAAVAALALAFVCGASFARDPVLTVAGTSLLLVAIALRTIRSPEAASGTRLPFVAGATYAAIAVGATSAVTYAARVQPNVDAAATALQTLGVAIFAGVSVLGRLDKSSLRRLVRSLLPASRRQSAAVDRADRASRAGDLRTCGPNDARLHPP